MWVRMNPPPVPRCLALALIDKLEPDLAAKVCRESWRRAVRRMKLVASWDNIHAVIDLLEANRNSFRILHLNDVDFGHLDKIDLSSLTELHLVRCHSINLHELVARLNTMPNLHTFATIWSSIHSTVPYTPSLRARSKLTSLTIATSRPVLTWLSRTLMARAAITKLAWQVDAPYNTWSAVLNHLVTVDFGSLEELELNVGSVTPALLKSMTKLKVIVLTASMSHALMDALGSMHTLEEIRLTPTKGQCKLDALASLPNLRVLYVLQFYMGSPWTATFRTLETLHLGTNGRFDLCPAKMVAQFPALTTLELLCDPPWNVVSELLTYYPNLTRLALQQTGYRIHHMVRLSSMQHLTTLLLYTPFDLSVDLTDTCPVFPSLRVLYTSARYIDVKQLARCMPKLRTFISDTQFFDDRHSDLPTAVAYRLPNCTVIHRPTRLMSIPGGFRRSAFDPTRFDINDVCSQYQHNGNQKKAQP